MENNSPRIDTIFKIIFIFHNILRIYRIINRKFFRESDFWMLNFILEYISIISIGNIPRKIKLLINELVYVDEIIIIMQMLCEWFFVIFNIIFNYREDNRNLFFRTFFKFLQFFHIFAIFLINIAKWKKKRNHYRIFAIKIIFNFV